MASHWEKWTIEELEKQMSPSRWNPNKSADDVIQQHIRICTAATQRAQQEIPHQCDVSYGASSSQKYDVYGTDLSVNAPIFIWIHGGYWQEGCKDTSATMAMTLHKLGIKTVVLGYTLAPHASLWEIQKEFLTALTKLLSEFQTANFYIGGHSAGAQIAAHLLHCDNERIQKTLGEKLKALFLVSGVYDLRPLVKTYVNDALKLTKEDAQRLSPLLQPFYGCTALKNLNIFISFGDLDSPEFVRQSREYELKLRTEYSNVDLWISKADDHFTIVENMSDVSNESSSGSYITNALRKLLKI